MAEMHNMETPCKTRDGASPAETFRALAVEYRFKEEIAARLVNTIKLESLADFKYIATKEEQLDDNLFALLGEEAKDGVQMARMRRAWHGVKAALREGSAVIEADLDELLGGKELADLRANYYGRHRQYLPPQRTPGDRLVSRLKRELDKRCVTLFDLTLIQTQSAQRAARKIKRKLASAGSVSLFAEEEQVDDHLNVEKFDPFTFDGFLTLLMIYLTALAIAGCTRRHGAPEAAESATSDPILYVEVPLELVQRYYWQVVLAGEKCGDLDIVRTKDREERAVWVNEFQNPNNVRKSLGEVIKEVMDKRSAHWDLARATKPQRQSSAGGPRPEAPQQGTCAVELRDGTRLCADYNGAGCPRATCNKPHRCGYVLSSGRVCGSWGHGYRSCPDHDRAEGKKRRVRGS